MRQYFSLLIETVIGAPFTIFLVFFIGGPLALPPSVCNVNNGWPFCMPGSRARSLDGAPSAFVWTPFRSRRACSATAPISSRSPNVKPGFFLYAWLSPPSFAAPLFSLDRTESNPPLLFRHTWRSRLDCFMPGSRARSLSGRDGPALLGRRSFLSAVEATARSSSRSLLQQIVKLQRRSKSLYTSKSIL